MRLSVSEIREGSIHLEWAIAFIIFMSGVLLAIKMSETHIVNTYSLSVSPDSISLRVTDLLLNLQESSSSYELRTYVCNTTNYRMSLHIINTSPVVCYQASLPVPSYFSESASILEVIANTTLPLTCIQSDRISQYECVSDIKVGGGTMENTRVSIAYSGNLITSFQYEGVEILQSPLIISPDTLRQEENRCSYGYADFGNTSLQLDAYAARVWIKATEPSTYAFGLRKIFTGYFDGDNSGILYDGLTLSRTTDFFALYDDDNLSMSFIGTDMNITMKVLPNKIEVNIFNVRKIEIFMCHFNYTCALCEKTLFNYNSIPINSPLSLELIPEKVLASMNDTSYDELRQILGISDYQFNLTVGNYSFGKPIPKYTDVWVRRFPIIVLNDNGTIRMASCTLSMWR